MASVLLSNSGVPLRPAADRQRRASAPTGGSAPKVWAVGGGKGGVGKSVVAVNLAVSLARAGHRVVLVDGDLGGANLETLLGCPRPARTLSHFFRREVGSLADLEVPTGVDGLTLVAGDSEVLGSANPVHAQKLKLIRHLRRLPCDVVILDLGAGTSFNTLDLFNAADIGLTVTTPEPTAVQNCFAFIKAAMLRELERHSGVSRRGPEAAAALREVGAKRATRVVVNRAAPAEGRRIAGLLHDLAGRFLSGRVELAATIRDDPAVGASIRRMAPLCSVQPTSPAALDIQGLGSTLLAPRDRAPAAGSGGGLNDEFVLHGRVVHVQTEDLGPTTGVIRTQVFVDHGRVAYSRRTTYHDNFFVRLGVGGSDRVRFHHAAIRRALELGRIELPEPVERKTA